MTVASKGSWRKFMALPRKVREAAEKAADYKNLDERCEWAEQQLQNWKFVTRLSHQEWKFFNKRSAEKFITLFNLRWTR